MAPTNPNAWCFLGMACHDQERHTEAEEAYRQALRTKPDFPVALSNLGNTLKSLGKIDEAIASCREALRYKPDYSTAFNNLGAALVAKGDLEEAEKTFQEALRLMPSDAVAKASLGVAQLKQGRFSEATESSEQAVKLNPRYAEAHKNLGIVWLLRGDFERGWEEYDWRLHCAGTPRPKFEQPRWDGTSLEDRTILLYAEQGLGDTIQFVRYAAILKRSAASVIVVVQEPLLKLLEHCEGIDHLLSRKAAFPHFDVWAPLLDVPRQLKTRLDTITADIPYLSADPALVESWRERLAPYPGFRIGIAWQGSPGFYADRERSIPLRAFTPLAQIPGVRLINLQKDHGRDQMDELNGLFEIIDFGDALDADSGAFMDTAAIMKNLDLVVGADTSVNHLAGALGVRTWIPLCASPDWRWFLDREDSPWYPTVRLFRQSTLYDWEEPFRRIADEVRSLASEPLETPAPSENPPAIETPHETTDAPLPAPRVLLAEGFNRLQECRHGPMLFNHNDMYIGRSLEQYGEFSEGEIELFSQFVRPGDVAIEAGANIGAHTVFLAKQVESAGSVYAFEPQRIVFQTLCANVALNGLANVDCRHQALGNEVGEIVVPHLDYARENNFGGLGLGQYTQGETVPVNTVDSLNVPGCRFIKIDVEGMEQSVLRGARETIGKYRPVLYVENDRAPQSAALIETIMAMGYVLFWHLPPMFRRKNYYDNPINVFGKIVSINMVCFHPEGDVRIEGLKRIESPSSNWRGGLTAELTDWRIGDTKTKNRGRGRAR